MSSEPYQIALWGPPRVGKTALLVYLIEAAAKTEWDVRPATPQSWKFVEDMRKKLLENQFPEATAKAHSDEVVYRLVRGTRQALLKVEDMAGGRWLELEEKGRDVLGKADALVLLIDPMKPAVVIDRQIRSMLDLLSLDHAHASDMRPVAVCVSKVDAFIERPEDLDEAVRSPDTFVRRRLHRAISEELQTFVRRRCPNHRFFPISAVGVRVQNGIVRHAVLLDERLKLRATSSGTPINLTAPFDWIFGQLEARA